MDPAQLPWSGIPGIPSILSSCQLSSLLSLSIIHICVFFYCLLNIGKSGYLGYTLEDMAYHSGNKSGNNLGYALKFAFRVEFEALVNPFLIPARTAPDTFNSDYGGPEIQAESREGTRMMTVPFTPRPPCFVEPSTAYDGLRIHRAKLFHEDRHR